MHEQQKQEIAERLKELRNNSSETNRTIAEACGVGERSVANWMSADTGMRYENAEAVAELFGIEVTWLWAGEGERTKGPTPYPFPTKSGEASDALLKELIAGQLVLKTQLERVEKSLTELRSEQSAPAQSETAES